MKKTLRGRVLSFSRMPQSIDDLAALTFIEDGAVVIDGGTITEIGEYSRIGAKGEVIDHRPYLISAGFVDPHIHFPQAQVVGSYSAELLDWLNDHTFPEEMRFADEDHANRIAKAFFDQLVAHGTTTVVAFCTSSAASVNAYFAEGYRRSMRIIGGLTMMDRNAPAGLCDTAQSSHDNSMELIRAWNGKARLSYAITPRFAITSSEGQMEVVRSLHKEFPSLHIQTHLSENKAEIELACSLFPDAKNYLDIYDRYQLLGPKTLMGHAIHLSSDEMARMAETQTVAIHCPTSNLFLGSGLFDLKGFEAAGVQTAIATDIGGGTSWSMFRTLDEAYKIQQLLGHRLNPLKSFYWATLGNATALGLEGKIGNLEVGTEADIVILDSRATQAMALRMERVETIAQELFVLQTMGDDRSVKRTYIAGQDSSETA